MTTGMTSSLGRVLPFTKIRLQQGFRASHHTYNTL